MLAWTRPNTAIPTLQTRARTARPVGRTRPQAERDGSPQVDDEEQPDRDMHRDQRIAMPRPHQDPEGHLHDGDCASDDLSHENRRHGRPPPIEYLYR